MKKIFALLFTVISTISLNAQVVESVEVEWPRKIEPDKNIVSKNKLGKNQIRTATYSILPETTPPPNRLERWANRKTQILHLIKDCNIDIIGTQRAYSRQISQLAKLSGYSVVTNSDSIPHAILYNSSRLKQEACGFLSLTSENRYDQTPHTCTWAKFKETDGGKNVLRVQHIPSHCRRSRNSPATNKKNSRKKACNNNCRPFCAAIQARPDGF